MNERRSGNSDGTKIQFPLAFDRLEKEYHDRLFIDIRLWMDF